MYECVYGLSVINTSSLLIWMEQPLFSEGRKIHSYLLKSFLLFTEFIGEVMFTYHTTR